MSAAMIGSLMGVAELPEHGVSGCELEQRRRDERIGADPDLWLYRDRTLGMLRRYLRFSIEVGRLPSLLGREFFRSRVTSYSTTTFEDSVIFVHDMEQSLEKLDELSRSVIAKVIFQQYSHDEAAALLGCGRRNVARLLSDGLDQLSEILLEGGLLNRLAGTFPKREISCQGGKRSEFAVSG